MDTLYIVMPAYNEEANIEETIKKWYEVLSKINANDLSRLVVFNDGSIDRTFEIACSLQKSYPLLSVIDKANSGHGPTVIEAYKYAINSKAKYIFMTDSDGQTDPKEFINFWNKRNEFDAIFGLRVNRGDGKFRKFVERVVCFLVYIFFGVKVRDANAPFRLYKSNILSKYIDRLPNDYNLPNIMITVFMSYYHENISFQKISFKARNAGKNSINYKKIFKIGLNSIRAFYKFRKNM